MSSRDDWNGLHLPPQLAAAYNKAIDRIREEDGVARADPHKSLILNAQWSALKNSGNRWRNASERLELLLIVDALSCSMKMQKAKSQTSNGRIAAFEAAYAGSSPVSAYSSLIKCVLA
jgi:hypothetical protein